MHALLQIRHTYGPYRPGPARAAPQGPSCSACHRPATATAPASAPAQRVTAVAWSPLVQGRAYTFATAAADEITLWSIDPFSGLMSGQKVGRQAA